MKSHTQYHSCLSTAQGEAHVSLAGVSAPCHTMADDASPAPVLCTGLREKSLLVPGSPYWRASLKPSPHPKQHQREPLPPSPSGPLLNTSSSAQPRKSPCRQTVPNSPLRALPSLSCWQLLSDALGLPGFLLLSSAAVLSPTSPFVQKQNFFKTLDCR